MKTRDSGMPDEAYWETFFDPAAVLTTLGLDRVAGPVVDVGAGYGTFSIAMAGMTHHPVIAIDIEPSLVEALAARAAGLPHVEARLHDVTGVGLGVEHGSADVVLLFNLLHCEDPVALLRAARTALRPSGRVGIIHWRSDVPTPRGPALAIRPLPENCVAWAMAAGLTVSVPPLVLPPYHFGLVATRLA